MARRYNRDETWERWISLAGLLDVVELAQKFAQPDGVEEPITSTFRARLRNPSSDVFAEDRPEFESEVAETAREDVREVMIIVGGTGDARGGVAFFLSELGQGRSLRLSIDGEDRTWVEGVFPQLREEIDRRVKAEEKHEEEEREAAEREALETEARRRALQEQREASSKPSLAPDPATSQPPPTQQSLTSAQKILNHPWVVGIGAGLIVAVIAVWLGLN